MAHSNEKRISAITLYQSNKSSTEISEQIKVPLRTVERWIQTFKETGEMQKKNSSGRPKKLNERDERQIVRAAKLNRRQTLSDITNVSAVKVSTRTIRCTLHAHNVFSRIAKKKPFLHPRHIEGRRKFTDESTFETGKNSRIVRVWRECHEVDYLECMTPSFKSQRSSVMIWEAITYGRKSNLVFMDKNKRTAVDSVDQVYAGELYSFWNTLDDPVLMEDGAPVHRANAPKVWREKNRVIKLDWPAQSPDLNPIEHVWMIMKTEVQKKMFNRPKTLELMKIAIQESWDEIPIEKINTLVDSVPSRLKLVKKACGRSTKTGDQPYDAFHGLQRANEELLILLKDEATSVVKYAKTIYCKAT
ncbi:hypothetical protein INT45_012486 [Circinella minor]|uniref:Tc1-like transposase DDE domain-containing protein n=1 Tax=Circinella minor TaxID=1195481 RepID=A0A8H7VEY8_9FUNG|nr:hypothetical protein INT45_012486 [Circinella minor]